ncbi:GTPase/DUF3482 domain-containing protein [Panacagrimonas sp.]|uniref:GTPase/DUF3482 domain-containing protein n=1 Tax=Panacagrimonas sp. TaxID=2480088 RepID=UPI003B5187E0
MNAASPQPPVRLAVVGHTNTGKTSLMRTLTRDAAFGEVSDRPATTRDVRGVDLLVNDEPLMSLFDTPGLEDPLGVIDAMAALEEAPDPVARIDAFIAGDHGHGRYEQEAKVLRQLRASDAALYVVDVREPMLARHHRELRLLADCGRPLLPVLNFVAHEQADAQAWREGLARSGLHVLADYDTVIYDHAAEQDLFDKLQLLLASRRDQITRLTRHRAEQRAMLIEDACRCVGGLLIDVAGLQMRGTLQDDLQQQTQTLQARVRHAEQACVDALLAQFRFDLQAYAPPQLPLQQGRWVLDPFDPEALRVLGVRTSSAIAAGAVGGLSVDAMLGGASLGTGAALGAGAGALVSGYRHFGRHWVDRLRGYRTLVVEEQTLAVLAARQLELLRALLRRGHAATAAVTTGTVSGWPSAALREAVMRARAYPQWSELNSSLPADAAGVQPVAEALKELLIPVSP